MDSDGTCDIPYIRRTFRDSNFENCFSKELEKLQSELSTHRGVIYAKVNESPIIDM